MYFIKNDNFGFGTSLQGYVYASYDDLVSVFGQPSVGPDKPSSDEKVTCEWNLEFEDGTVATIYDWKEYTGKTPRGRYEWHVGGRGRSVESLIHEALNGNHHLVDEFEEEDY